MSHRDACHSPNQPPDNWKHKHTPLAKLNADSPVSTELKMKKTKGSLSASSISKSGPLQDGARASHYYGEQVAILPPFPPLSLPPIQTSPWGPAGN